MAVQDPAYIPSSEDALLIEPGPAISWRAIVAGAVAAAALSFVLLAVGAAFGLSMVSPWDAGDTGDAGETAAAFGIGAAIFLILVHAISSGFGGYIAGRLREKLTNLKHDETVFRDTAHGMLVWALSAVVGAFLIANLSAQIASGGLALGAAGVSAAGQMAGGAMAGAGTAMAGAGQEADRGDRAGGVDPFGYYVDTLFRPTSPGGQAGTQAGTAGSTTPDATGTGTTGTAVQPAPSPVPDLSASAASTAAAGPEREMTRGEVGRIFRQAMLDGQINAEDKTYAAQLIARETGMTQQEAEARVDEVVGKAQAARQEVETKAKEAAEAARQGARAAAIWSAVAMLIGAFAASFGAHAGGRARDLV